MIDETSIDIVISGLKGLYEKLAAKEQVKSHPAASQQQQYHGIEEEHKGELWFDSEKDKCLLALKELFLHRVNANREKRLRQNEGNICIRGVTRVFWISRIMVYLPLEECMKMGQLCVYFSQLTKSPLFVKFMV